MKRIIRHSRRLIPIVGLINLFILSTTIHAIAQDDCSCDEYVYLNEVDGPGQGSVHKFKVEPDGSLTEINPDGPWYPNGGVSEMSLPHGLGSDLNGYLYIGENLEGDSRIRRLDCDGNIMPTSVYAIENAPTFNLTSTGNIAFSTTLGESDVQAYNLCDGELVGTVCLESSSGAPVDHGWGLYEYPEGTFYTYSVANGGSVYKFTANDLNGGCVSPIFEGPSEITIPATVYGLTVDSQGNVYIVENNFGGNGPGKILKFDANGNFLCETPLDTTDGDGGYYGIFGIVYSPSCDCLYSSNFTLEDDCVSRFDLNCNYVGPVVDPVGGVSNNTEAIFGKAIAIQNECCPLFDSRDYDMFVCDPIPGEVYFMIDFLPCEFICAGQWEVISNTAGTFNECNNSFTYEQVGTGCFTYVYNPTGNSANVLCQPFEINVCVHFGITPGPPVITNQCLDQGGGAFVLETDCPSGTILEYSTDNGANWSTTLPTWAEGVTVIGRCEAVGNFPCIGNPSSPPTLANCNICEDICGIAFLDENGDGCYDQADVDTPAPGLTVILQDCNGNNILDENGEVISTTTEADGSYCLEVCNIDGPFRVNFTTPSGYEPTANMGCDSDIDDNGNTNCGGTDGGFSPCVTIGGTVFTDANNDGCQSASENGIEGLTIQLFDCSNPNVPVISTTTAGDGSYNFGGVDSTTGNCILDNETTYSVSVVLPNGYVYSTGAGIGCRGNNDDSPLNDGNSECYQPNDDGNDHIDFGIDCDELCGTAFLDENADGCSDPTDSPAPGLTVTLQDCNGNPLLDGNGNMVTTTTNSDGNYCFSLCGFAGPFSVNFSSPSGYEPTANMQCDSDINDDGNTNCGGTDGGFSPCTTIAGTVFNDGNNDGCQTASENGLGGFTVQLFDCNNPSVPVTTTTTSADGSYSFGGTDTTTGNCILDNETTYSVSIVLPSGYVHSTGAGTGCPGNNDDSPTNDGNSECYQPNDDDNDHIDFGVDCDQLCGTAFFDENGDGCNENTEFPAPGLTVTLQDCNGNAVLDGNGNPVTTVTDNDGNYCFDLCGYMGPFSVNFTSPTGYEPTASTACDSDIDGNGNTNCGGTDGGFSPCTTIAGTIFTDGNNDGCQSASEGGLGGVTVQLFDCNNPNVPVTSTMTAADGSYAFGGTDSATGTCILDNTTTYSISIVLPSGYVYSTGAGSGCPGNNDDSPQNDGNSDCYSPHDDDNDHIDFGVDCDLFCGMAFLDENGDGCNNEQDTPASGLTVTLQDCNGNPILDNAGNEITTTTDSNGNYCFELCGLEGPFTVNFSSPQGYEPTEDSDCDSDIDANGNTGCEEGDGGFSPCETIEGTVFIDPNNTGCQEDEETEGLGGVNVYLYNCNDANQTPDNAVASTTTDADGNYIFEPDASNNFLCLDKDGEYNVVFDLPELSGQSLAFSNMDDCSGTPDASDVDVDTGASDCVTPEDDDSDHVDGGVVFLAAIGGVAFHDQNGDGIIDSSEETFQDITVTLYDSNGNVVATTVTDSNGNYIFEDLYPGDYYIGFGSNDPYEPTLPNQGSNGAIDSDLTSFNGPNTTAVTTLTAGERDLTWNAGYYQCVQIGENVWYDINLNDVRDDLENGINGIKVNLYRRVGNAWLLWDNTFTGHKPNTPSDDGYFKFCTNPGMYYLQFEIPPYGLVNTLPFIGNDNNRDSDVDGSNGPGTTATFEARSGGEICNIGAGYYPMATIGDMVWQDANQDGVRQSNEPSIQGVRVEAYDIYNQKIGEDVSSSSGGYLIDYLRKESYYLRFYPPAGYTLTAANVSQENVDSDVDHSNGPNTTDFYYMLPGQHTANVDAGFVFGALPVSIARFAGQFKKTYNHVEWDIATEVNIDYYEVERKGPNANTFESIGSLKSIERFGEENAYDFKDYDVLENGTYYYRIKIVDMEGLIEYSDVISIAVQRRVKQITLYPNPTKDLLYVNVETIGHESIQLSLINMEGKSFQIVPKEEVSSEGKNTLSVDVSNVPSGQYSLQVQLGNQVYYENLSILRE